MGMAYEYMMHVKAGPTHLLPLTRPWSPHLLRLLRFPTRPTPPTATPIAVHMIEDLAHAAQQHCRDLHACWCW